MTCESTSVSLFTALPLVLVEASASGMSDGGTSGGSFGDAAGVSGGEADDRDRLEAYTRLRDGRTG